MSYCVKTHNFYVAVTRMKFMKTRRFLNNCLKECMHVCCESTAVEFTFLGGCEGSTILRVLQRPSHEQAQTGSLRSYVTKQGCTWMREKSFFFVFLIFPLNFYIKSSNKRYLIFILSAALI